MTGKLHSRGKVLIYNVLALLLGIVTAVALVTLYEFVDYTVRNPGPPPPPDRALFTRQMAISAAAMFSTGYAVIIAMVCAPIWLLLIRLRLAGWLSAAALGFVAAVIAWADVQPVSNDVNFWILRALVYGPCGAAAGLVTWWASPARRSAAASLSNKASHSDSSTSV